MGAVGVALGVVATFCVEGWLEEERLDEVGVLDDDEVLDGDDTLDGDEEEPAEGELDEAELFNELKESEPELDDVDGLVDVVGCFSWHI